MRYCEDAPCCGCCDVRGEEPYECDDFDDVTEYDDVDESMDGDHQTALESVYGPEDSYLDAHWEDQYDLGD